MLAQAVGCVFLRLPLDGANFGTSQSLFVDLGFGLRHGLGAGFSLGVEILSAPELAHGTVVVLRSILGFN